ncbi:DsrE family protein [Polynucleobacter cosmopolitanus]|uniref:DsrE family protein n=1 Tax=Polynucleobacter cosmopolitanus TaxID=351345 RepID=UPI0011810724|nr:DsrE family protein [Polynucleobacter cosmopolitanus]
MKRLILQLWRTSADQPNLAVTPFLMASTAAAINFDVEIHAIGASVDLFIKANPKNQQIVTPSNRPLSAFVEDAIRTGVKIKVCSTALRDRQLELGDLVEGVTEVIGMVTMIDLATNSNTTVFTY